MAESAPSPGGLAKLAEVVSPDVGRRRTAVSSRPAHSGIACHKSASGACILQAGQVINLWFAIFAAVEVYDTGRCRECRGVAIVLLPHRISYSPQFLDFGTPVSN